VSEAIDLVRDGFGRVREAVHGVLVGIDPEAVTYRPAPEANSVAWLVWHLARIQDDHVADMAGGKQEWISGGWYDRFGLPFPPASTGYGHGPGEVAVVRAGADLLLAYYDAVHAATERFLDGIAEPDLSRVVDGDYDPPVTMAVRLVSVISDDLQHAGQAAYLRGIAP